MNILAVDYGTKRIGLAWADTDMGTVLPYGLIETDNQIAALQKLLTEESVDTLVFGLPVNMDGKDNENTKAICAFAEKISSLADIPVQFIDERFTSQQADNTPGDVSRDEKAAMIILQTYLDK